MTLLKRFRSLFRSRYLAQSSVGKRYALAEACLIGLVSAFAALLLKQGIGWLGWCRIQAANYFGAGLALPIVGLILGILAGWCIEQLSPEASGGGIPQVKAVLARFPLPLSLRVAIVKTIGTILVLGAGFTLGRRGPTVHIGAALAAQLSRWVPTSPEHRRQMIAAGAAAGLAAGFNTPIAGVLFVIEELMRDMSGLTLETAIIASFTGAVVSRLLGSADLNISAQILNFSEQGNFYVSEIPLYMLLGVLAGILGGLFNRGILFSLDWNRRLNWSMPWRVGLAGLISGIIIALLPPFFRDNAGLREFLITGGVGWQIRAIAFIAHFFLTLLAYGSGASGGLFAPTLVLGSALGYLVGSFNVFLLGFGSEYTYALAGMGAFFTAVARVPVTAIVIVFEITTDFNLVLPLMVASVVAYIVAEGISSGSLYEHLLEASGIELQDETPSNHILTQLTAAEVMQSEVETFCITLTLEEVRKRMSLSHHRGFPVVDKEELVGIITQKDLPKKTNKSGQITLGEIMTPHPVTVKLHASLGDVLYLLDHYKLSRLPVTEGRKLLGIITRTDIIRAEVNRLSGETKQTVSQSQPSYVVYQTRSPALGKGRMLLPLSNPHNVSALLEIAVAIANYRQYELECLQIIKAPKHNILSQTTVNIRRSRKLLRKVERLGDKCKIPVHTQIQVAHNTAQAILETITQRHINLMLMGWKGSTSTPGQIFGNLVDHLIQHATCDLVLIKQGQQPNSFPNQSTSWLIPISGGPNVQRAIQLLPALREINSESSPSRIWLCQVYSPLESDPDLTALDKTANFLKDDLDLPVMPIPIRSHSVSEAVINLARVEKCNVVMLGASREGLLQHAIHGNIPEAIAQGVNSTVIIVRGSL